MSEFLPEDELRRLYVGAMKENTDLFIERNALRAEVAALREEFSSYVTRSSEDWMKLERELAALREKNERQASALRTTRDFAHNIEQQRIRAERDLAEARALLADWERDESKGYIGTKLRNDTRAFLRRDEGER